MRYFLIPMQAPANGTGKGTKVDPWRPKYLRESGLSYSIHNAREFCLAQVWGDEKALEELAGMSDVEEVFDSSEAISGQKLTKVLAAVRGLSLRNVDTGHDFLVSLRESIAAKQRAER